MLRPIIVALVVALALPAICVAQEQKPDKLSLDVTDQAVTEVAKTLADASGVTVLPTQAAGEAKATVKVTDVDLEAAVTAVAEAIDGSWLRTYVIEPAGESTTEPTIDIVVERLQIAWRDWMLSCTNEELDAFRERALAAMDGPPTPPQPTATGGIMFDVVDTLRGPFHAEQITLKLDAADIREALKQFTLQSGYITLLSDGVTGQVTLDVTDEKLPKVLDAICAATNAKWRPLYVLGKAREITPDEMEQRLTDMLQRGADEFFKLPPDQRQQIIQRLTERMNSIPPEARDAIRNSPWTGRIMGRVMQFMFNLTPDQRREIAPLMQGFGKLMGP
ncbi:MAG: hypothetical protein FJX75_27330 [Armatimonadetes bacterium]|nr:hypothetical protein [Armatimonadota bacterium]